MEKKKKNVDPLKVVGKPGPPIDERRFAPLRQTGSAADKKKQFAANLDWLLRATCLTRKEAANAIGVDYRVILRLVSAGVSRIDVGNKDNLAKLTDFFCLDSIDSLWAFNLVRWLLLSYGGEGFVNKFRTQLEKYKQSLSDTSFFTHGNEIKLIAKAIRQETIIRDDELISRCEFILSSSIGKRFESVIEDYFQMAKPREAV